MNHFINIRDISTSNLKKIIADAKKRKLKRKKLNTLDSDKDSPLKGKLLIQMFEKTSLRTRISFYIAIKQLNGGALTLRPDELHLNTGGESLVDTAKIISTFGNVFMLRTDSEKKLEILKRHMTIPIINGLSPKSHPTQILSDVFTIEEIKKKPISKLQICWIGDSNNVLTSLIEASVKFSFKLHIGSPKKYEPKQTLLDWAKKNKGKIKIFNNSQKAASESDVIFTDKVISINDKVDKIKKLKDFNDFKINHKVMAAAKKDAIFLHCLPRGSEVSNDVFLGKQSKVFQQALNRIYVQKSILLYCLKKLR
tara:strand:- start:2468 stop:3397 length:930 start_codon:yes stop_codon:yes gene_type:complete